MKIGEKEIKQIIITDKDKGLLVSITDDDVITHDSCDVEIVEN